METLPRQLQERQIARSTQADLAYSESVAKGLGLMPKS